MATPYIEELALESKNNEAISEIISLRENVGTAEAPDIRPVNLTGREFFAQARTGKSVEADLMCEISVTIYGDPLNGQLLFEVSAAVMKDVPPIKGHYDVLSRTGENTKVDNLYQAPFRVTAGVTDVSNWV